jgi:hypothetical protein
MKSDIIQIDNQGIGFQDALEQTALSARFRALIDRESLRLRLLTEEMLGMLREITGETEARFWVESEGKQFELHLLARPIITGRMREELLSVSSTGRNAAAVGVMGKLRDIFERAYDVTDVRDVSDYYSRGLMLTAGPEGIDPMTFSVNASMVAWSMQKYKTTVAAEKETDEAAMQEWDELEKSIIANLADEVSISIRAREVEMVVYKSFGQK